MNKKAFLDNLKNQDKKPDLIFIITDQERATQNFPDNWERENLKTLSFLKVKPFVILVCVHQVDLRC
jgi:choline-sulfatase